MQKKLFKSPFTPSFWKESAKEFANIKSICYAALLCAFAIVIEYFQVPITESLYISFSFLVISLCSMLTGPLMAIPCGIIVDLIGYVIHPQGAFFPGYTLTAVLTAFVYALFLYRSDLSFWRIAVSKLIINLVINTFIGSIWRIVLYGTSPFLYYIILAGVKNIALFPLECVLICVLFRALQKPLLSLRAIPEGTKARISSKEIVLLVILTVLGAAAVILFAINYPAIKDAIKGIFA